MHYLFVTESNGEILCHSRNVIWRANRQLRHIVKGNNNQYNINVVSTFEFENVYINV